MKLINKVFALAAVLVLAGCGAQSAKTVETLNKAQAVGSPFTKSLTDQYRTFANAAQHDSIQYGDSLHFARKGLASASGVVVMPETLDDWDLGDKNLVEMTQARNDLVDALEGGGRELAPDKAASTQVAFDCWAQQQEKNWTQNVPCKAKFYDALKSLQGVVGAKPAPAPAVAEEFPAPVTEAPAKGQEAPVQQAMFIVFFDWNKHNLSSGANDVLDAVAQELKSRKDMKGIVIVGHTDTSGPNKYNKALSLKRGNAVRDGLVARGVDAKVLRVDGRGEDDLLVKTPDNVREPANRRAQITLE
jgi:OOP family OmpA-OmpF porin